MSVIDGFADSLIAKLGINREKLAQIVNGLMQQIAAIPGEKAALQQASRTTIAHFDQRFARIEASLVRIERAMKTSDGWPEIADVQPVLTRRIEGQTDA